MGKWNGSKWIRKERRLALYLRDRVTCQYCGRDLHDAANPHEVTLDHLVPRCEGGDNANANLITACLSCNSQRRDTDWREYATGGAIERIEAQIAKPINIGLAKAIIAGEARHPRAEALR